MKGFTLFISILFISLNVFAQEPDSILVEDWAVNDSYWEKSKLLVYTYSNDQLSLYVDKHYETDTESWINDSKRELEYSAEGYLIQRTKFFWDEDLDDWIVENKIVHTNDAAGNAVTLTTSYLEVDEWQPVALAENTFNTDGLLTESLRQTWNAETNEYVNVLKMSFTYDSNGNQINQLNQNFQNAEWVNNSQTTTQYTGFNAEEIAIRQFWNMENNDWKNLSKRTFTYNSDEFVIHSLFEISDIGTEEWLVYEQDNYANNPDGSIYQVVTQEFDYFLYEWQNDIRTTTSYRFSTAVSRVNPLEVGVYPNPSSTNVHIQLGESAARSTYTITDMRGKILANDSFYGSNTQISIDRFAAGIYLLEVEANGKTGIVKLVRE